MMLKNYSHLLGGVCAFSAMLGSLVVNADAVTGQGTWESTLIARDLDGDFSTIDAYYDTVLDITWLANVGTGMDWTSATAWAAGLNINGITGWRLPKIDPINGIAYDYNLYFDGSADRGLNISAPGTIYAGSTNSELAHLFHNTLGNLGYCDPASSTSTSCGGPQIGWGLTNTGPFGNLVAAGYWSGNEMPTDYTDAFGFDLNEGAQFTTDKIHGFRVWAVHDGDVGAAVIFPLEGRIPATPDGTDYQAYYDPNLNITWAANASISGQNSWDNQMAWVASLTIGGVCGWRLPSADVNGNGSVADCTTGLSDICSDNEMDYLFSVEGINAASPGPFNIPFNPNSASYSWSGTEFDSNNAWDFEFNNGNQGIGNKNAEDYAWPVHDGDVTVAPISADGDITLDGIVNAADVLLGLQVLNNEATLSSTQLLHGDVAPIVSCQSAPDGQFTLGDLLVIERKVLGVVDF